MSDSSRDLSALARRCGVQEFWTDAHQRPQRVAPESLRRLISALGLKADTPDDVAASHAALDVDEHHNDPLLVGRAGQMMSLSGWRAGTAVLRGEDQGTVRQVTLLPDTHGAQCPLTAPPGYYELLQAGRPPQRLAITPRAPDLASLLGRHPARSWGLMTQVYSLRQQDSARVRSTWGHGDMATVAGVAQRLGKAGADVLALNPLHAMFSAHPAACSPYSPSNRHFFNVLYAAPALVVGDAAVREACASLPEADWQHIDDGEVIDWPRAAHLRMRVLRHLHDKLPQMDSALRADYASFLSKHGQALRDHAVFEALHARQPDPGEPWTKWDLAWRDARSASVRDFAAHHAQEVDFHCFAQWLAASSLSRAQREARLVGMGVGLLSDLAVGVSPAGSQVWSDLKSFLQGVSIGAPPDIHQPLGQSWGLAALSPMTLRKRGFQPFIEVLRAALSRTGGTRIDHILGMERLWLVPDGGTPADGAYVQLPGQSLLGLIALEASRHRSLVIGENLGTVPDGFDDRLREHGIAGMNVLWFMREASGDPPAFLDASLWPVDAAALTTTHDLPTLTGWWNGTDIQQRESAGRLGDSHTAAHLMQEREADKDAMWICMGGGPDAPAEAPDAALLALVGSAPCALALASLEDIAGVDEAPNVPGTTHEFPNWRRRLPGDTLASLCSPAWQDRINAFKRGREAA